MKVKIENRDDMIRILTEIYDCRLKALIGYESTACTQEIIEYMFKFLDFIERNYKDLRLREIDTMFINPILSYTPDSEVHYEYLAKDASKDLIPKLETYIKTCVDLLYPDWEKSYKEDEYRKVLGIKFKEELRKNKQKYPAKLHENNFFAQLNYTTQFRNKWAHDLDESFAEYCNRHYILQTYDILLSYLLYTFYYMVLKGEPINHLTPQKK